MLLLGFGETSFDQITKHHPQLTWIKVEDEGRHVRCSVACMTSVLLHCLETYCFNLLEFDPGVREGEVCI